MQIAFDSTVYVSHIDRSWGSCLPPSLVRFLQNPEIRKIGRNVGGDLSRIQTGYHIVCKGALDLGAFCSSRKCIPSGRISLSDISSLILGSRISKDERLSDWDCYELSSEEQVRYAALDAWAGLAIYNAVANKPVMGIRVNSSHCQPDTFVALKPPGSKIVVAYGEILCTENAVISPGKNEISVRIIRVKVPGYVLPPKVNRAAISLDSFGEPPFIINIIMSHLMIEDRSSVINAHRSTASLINVENVPVISNDDNLADNAVTSSSSSTTPEEAQAAFDEIFPTTSSSSVDKSSFLFGYQLFSTIRTNPSSDTDNQSQRVYTRVIKDIFHLMDMIKPYKRHGLYKEFTRRFSDSLVTIDETDERRLNML